MKISKLFVGIFAASCILSISAQAQSLATVNGSKISSKQVDEWTKTAATGEVKDSPELRQNILNEIILREAIFQDIEKTGLATKGDNAFAIKTAQQNVLVDLWFAEYFKKHPVGEDQVKAEYKKQLALSKEPKYAKEYEVAQIVVATEKEGQDVIAQINSGKSFETLAKSKSLDKVTGEQGGLVGWALSDQYIEPIGALVPGLVKGKVDQKPVKTNLGWHVIKLVDSRAFVMPSYNDAKSNLAQTLVARGKQEAISDLMKDAKVTIDKN